MLSVTVCKTRITCICYLFVSLFVRVQQTLLCSIKYRYLTVLCHYYIHHCYYIVCKRHRLLSTGRVYLGCRRKRSVLHYLMWSDCHGVCHSSLWPKATTFEKLQKRDNLVTDSGHWKALVHPPNGPPPPHKDSDIMFTLLWI